jgi:hypothetical protein
LVTLFRIHPESVDATGALADRMRGKHIRKRQRKKSLMRVGATANFLLGFTQPKGSGNTPWRIASIAASKPKLLFSRMTFRSVWSAQRWSMRAWSRQGKNLKAKQSWSRAKRQPRAPDGANNFPHHASIVLKWNAPSAMRWSTLFETLEREYATARGWLGELLESPDTARYQQGRRITEDARLNYEVARLELEQHQRTHATA